jgi:restriction endonuclease Mrr
MTIPDYHTLMLPVLNIASDGVERCIRDVIDLLAKQFNLTKEERRRTAERPASNFRQSRSSG